MSETAISNTNEEYWLFGYGSLIWKPPPHFDLRIPGYITGYVRRFWQASEDHRGTPTSPGRVVTLISHSNYTTLSPSPSPSSPDPSPTTTTATTTTTTEPRERVYGAAYRIPARHVQEVQEYLDIREINGYSIEYTRFHPSSSQPPSSPPPSSSPSPTATATATSSSSSNPTSSHTHPTKTCLIYIGLPSNPQFLGRQSPDDIAAVIARSSGPSGANAEYLFMLEESLNGLGEGSRDEHVEDLAERVRALMKDGDGKGVHSSRKGNVSDGEMKMQAVENEIERVRSGKDGQAGEETEKVSQLQN